MIDNFRVSHGRQVSVSVGAWLLHKKFNTAICWLADSVLIIMHALTVNNNMPSYVIFS